jgi:hypothetical protein
MPEHAAESSARQPMLRRQQTQNVRSSRRHGGSPSPPVLREGTQDAFVPDGALRKPPLLGSEVRQDVDIRTRVLILLSRVLTLDDGGDRAGEGVPERESAPPVALIHAADARRLAECVE